MNPRLLGLITFVLFLLNAFVSSAAHSVFYDIASANAYQTSRSPQYTGNAQSFVVGSNLVREGLYVGNFSDLNVTGQWVQNGWTTSTLSGSNGPNISFSLTAVTPLRLGNLRYTFFSGNWSDIWIGPYTLHVWASKDGFATAQKISTARLMITKPWLNTTNNFVYDISTLGPLAAGETLTIRFLASHDGAYDEAHSAPSGFMNKYPDNYNPTVEVEPHLFAPNIVEHPISHIVQPGSTVTFYVVANAYPAPAYQWLFNGDPIAGATSSSHTVTNVAPGDVGGYSVLVSNTEGTNTSQTATLWLNSIKMFPGVVVHAPIGSPVTVRYTTNLQPPILWTALTNLTISSSPTVVIDYEAPPEPRMYQTIPSTP